MQQKKSKRERIRRTIELAIKLKKFHEEPRKADLREMLKQAIENTKVKK